MIKTFFLTARRPLNQKKLAEFSTFDTFKLKGKLGQDFSHRVKHPLS